MPDETPQPPLNRRSFFRAFLREGLVNYDQTKETISRTVGDAARRLTNADAPGAPTITPAGQTHARSSVAGGPAAEDGPQAAIHLRFLRPPGALAETEFASACSRSGACVKACPAHAILLREGIAGGLPYILARSQPCVVCEDLSCMKACPSGALTLVGRPDLIAMGKAVVIQESCLRTSGEPCTECIVVCPFGPTAIALDEQGQIEIRGGCTGCGLCERQCPTNPTSIFIEPAAEHSQIG